MHTEAVMRVVIIVALVVSVIPSLEPAGVGRPGAKDHDEDRAERGAKAPAERGVELPIVNAAVADMSVSPWGRIERGRALFPLEGPTPDRASPRAGDRTRPKPAGRVVVLSRATVWPSREESASNGGFLVARPAGAPRNDSAVGQDGETPEGSRQPYKEAGEAPLEYRGPGRESSEPEVDEIVLGWFGPGDPAHPTGGDFWRGAVLALEEVNEAGGSQGRPVRLVPGWSTDPWGTGVVQVTKMVYEHGAWAILGAIDGAATHLAEQVALKARVTLVSTGSTDATANMASVPWMFSCLPSDEAQGPALAGAVARRVGPGTFVVAAASEHDAHAALLGLRPALAARRLAPASLVEFDPVTRDLDALAGRLLEGRPRVVVVLAPAEAAARLVGALRGRGFAGDVVGGAPLALRAFARAAGEAAEGVVVPLLWEPSPDWDAFARIYENRWGEPPDHAAAQSYDAVRLVTEAVQRAGLNRARIRDAVRDVAPWRGAAGVVRWDALGRNERPAGLATWKKGRLEPILAHRGR